MATRIPSNLYTEGAVVFNQQPAINLYAQLAARKQARQEALDQYYQNLHKNINPAGMRAQDINGGWSQKAAEWERHFIENKQRISNPKTPEDRAIAVENQQRYQDLLMDIQKSKDAAQQELELGKNRLSGKWNPTRSDLDIANSISKSIYDPSYYKDESRTQPYTINDLSLNVPEPSIQEQEAFGKSSIGELKMKRIYDELNTRKIKETGQIAMNYEERYPADAIKKIGDKAASLIGGKNSPFYIKYERMLDDPNWAIGAGEAYRQVYGGDGILRTPQEAAKADAVMSAKNAVNSGVELRKDESLDLQRQIFMEGLRQKNRLQLLSERQKAKALGAAADDVWIDNYLDKLEEEANRPGGERMSYMTKEGTQPQAPVISVDPVLAKALEKQKMQPSDIMILPDGRYKPIYYQYKDGQRIPDREGSFKVDTELSVPITRDQLKLALGGKAVSPNQRTKEMLNQTKTPVTKSRPPLNSFIKNK